MKYVVALSGGVDFPLGTFQKKDVRQIAKKSDFKSHNQKDITEHLKTHHKDFHSRLGMKKLISTLNLRR